MGKMSRNILQLVQQRKEEKRAAKARLEVVAQDVDFVEVRDALQGGGQEGDAQEGRKVDDKADGNVSS